MTDHNATTGVLVTTSWFSRTSEQFAQRNRITLINGAELKHLIKQHLGYDVIPGTSPPKRLRASDNTQTGKPGPAANWTRLGTVSAQTSQPSRSTMLVRSPFA